MGSGKVPADEDRLISLKFNKNRRGSTTDGLWYSVNISEKEGNMIISTALYIF
jgi:hypothetical protein